MLSGPADLGLANYLDSNFRTPAVVISISSIGRKQDWPLFGILSAASIVNTHLK